MDENIPMDLLKRAFRRKSVDKKNIPDNKDEDTEKSTASFFPDVSVLPVEISFSLPKEADCCFR